MRQNKNKEMSQLGSGAVQSLWGNQLEPLLWMILVRFEFILNSFEDLKLTLHW